MKQSLQLKLGQQLTMTPQLQQAIKLLQLSTLDLQQEIQQALDSNPMLEIQEGTDEPVTEESQQESASELTAADETATDEAAADSDWQETIPEDLPVDSQWEDIYQPTTGALSAPAPAEGGDGGGGCGCN